VWGLDLTLLAFIGVTFVVAMSGAVFKPGDWYESLDRPDWRPPNWAFPIVWTILYAMMAVAAWLVWHAAGGLAGAPLAFGLFALQLLFNGAWSWLFFGLKRPDLALIDTAFMWLAILANALAFHAIRPEAGWLLAPYLLWVTIAFALNLSILRRNPQYSGRRA